MSEDDERGASRTPSNGCTSPIDDERAGEPDQRRRERAAPTRLSAIQSQPTVVIDSPTSRPRRRPLFAGLSIGARYRDFDAPVLRLVRLGVVRRDRVGLALARDRQPFGMREIRLQHRRRPISRAPPTARNSTGRRSCGSGRCRCSRRRGSRPAPCRARRRSSCAIGAKLRVDLGAAGGEQHEVADADEDRRRRLIGADLAGQDLVGERGADALELGRGPGDRVGRRLDRGFAGDRQLRAGMDLQPSSSASASAWPLSRLRRTR